MPPAATADLVGTKKIVIPTHAAAKAHGDESNGQHPRGDQKGGGRGKSVYQLEQGQAGL